MRTGKSKAVIDKAEYNFDQGAIEGCIVFAPNGVHLNWVLNEIPKWGWDWSHKVSSFAWETPRRGDPTYQLAFERFVNTKGMKYLCINNEALTEPMCREAIRTFLNACNRKFMLAVSEAHHYGHAGTKRTTKLRDLSKHAAFVTLETGTPILNSPLRAYSLFKILTGYLPAHIDTYEKFVQHFADIKDSEELHSRYPSLRRKAYKKIAGYKNMAELTSLFTPYCSVVTRDQVPDMPDLLRTERFVAMSDVQRRAYTEMASRYLLEVGDALVSAADAGPRMMKLQQILMGYVKDTEKESIEEIDAKAPVWDAIYDEVVGTLPGKSIVWFRFREDIRRFGVYLHRQKIPFAEYHGGVPTSRREPIRLQFQDPDSGVNVLLGQPATGAEGKDFSRARTIIFGSSTPNAIHVQQGEERGTKIGGEPVNVVRIRFRGTVDDRNWDIVDGKISLADTVSGHGLRDMLRLTDV